MALEELKKTEIIIEESSNTLLSSEEYDPDLARRIEDMIRKQESDVRDYLEEDDDNFAAIAASNVMLLQNENIVFEITDRSHSLKSTYTTEFNGEIDEEGKLDCNSTKTALISMGSHPKSYSGSINYLGEINIVADEYVLDMFTLGQPETYIGGIDSQGNISFKIDETVIKVIALNWYANVLSADVFEGNDENRRKFLSNKNELKKIIEDFRAQLLKV